MKENVKTNLGIVARILLGLILITSGFPKAAAPWQEFAAVMESYALDVSPNVLWTMAKILPWALLFFGLFLIFGYLTKLSAVAAVAMASTFFLALLSAVTRHVPLDHCGCFGAVNLKPWQAMTLDVFCAAMAVCAFQFGRRRWSLDNWIDAGI